jgi:hypothetical protein
LVVVISQLHENNEILDVVLESADDMIWANEAEGLGLIAFNSALARYFSDNFGVELRLGMTPDDMLPPEDNVTSIPSRVTDTCLWWMTKSL